jgi:gingipain R
LRAIGLGSNEGQGIGHMGEPDWQHLRNIRTDLLGYGFTQVHEFYDGSQGGADASGNPNSTIINAAVNDGITLFNYTGHGDLNTCITGNYGSSNINSATNAGKYPFVISVACNNGTFTTGTCLAESWQRATHNTLGSPTGSIGVAASSILMAWAPPMATQDEIVDILTEKYPSNQLQTLGGLFYSGQMYMLDSYNSSNTAKEVYETWVFFGDPSVMDIESLAKELEKNKDKQFCVDKEIGKEISQMLSLDLTEEELDSLIAHTGEAVKILFDTGHMTFAGGNSLKVINQPS